MTGNDDETDADWLAAQFGQNGGVPTEKPEPKKPVVPQQPPADPPTLVNPFGAPGAVPPAPTYQPPVAPPVYQPPVAPPVYQPPTAPPVYQPPVAPPVYHQPPVAPPVYQPPTSPPVQPPAAATPPEPGEPVAQPFPWALQPAADPEQAAPVAPPPVLPPVVPPVLPPPAPTEPYAWSATSASEPTPYREPEPTQAMDQVAYSEQPPTQLILPPVESFGAGAAATELLGASPDPANDPTSALDALFGESRFREYEPGADESQSPFNRPEAPKRGSRGPAGIGTTQKVLIGVAGGLVAILALIALYLVGTRLPDLLAAEPVATPSVEPTPTPSVTVPPVGPLAPGTYAWDELLGAECLDPFDTPWAEEFTVVACDTPHPGQLVYRGTFAEADTVSYDLYPGEEALRSKLTVLCSAKGVIAYSKATKYSDVQMQYSYPVTEEQWLDGNHSYFCFVNRASGKPFTTSIAGPLATTPVKQPTPEPSDAPTEGAN